MYDNFLHLGTRDGGCKADVKNSQVMRKRHLKIESGAQKRGQG